MTMQQQFPLPLFEDFAEPVEPSATEVSQVFREQYEAGGTQARYQARYNLLVSKGYPWRVAAYISWVCTPADLRGAYRTLEDFCKLIGLSGTRAVYNWRAKYVNLEKEIAAFAAYLIGEEVAGVVDAMLTVAQTPSPKAFNDRRMALIMAGVYDSKSDQPSTTINNIAGKSDAELEELAGE